MSSNTNGKVLLVIADAEEKFGKHLELLNGIFEVATVLGVDQTEDFILRLPEVPAKIIWKDFIDRSYASKEEFKFPAYAQKILSGDEVYRLYLPPTKNPRCKRSRRKR